MAPQVTPQMSLTPGGIWTTCLQRAIFQRLILGSLSSNVCDISRMHSLYGETSRPEYAAEAIYVECLHTDIAVEQTTIVLPRTHLLIVSTVFT